MRSREVRQPPWPCSLGGCVTREVRVAKVNEPTGGEGEIERVRAEQQAAKRPTTQPGKLASKLAAGTDQDLGGRRARMY